MRNNRVVMTEDMRRVESELLEMANTLRGTRVERPGNGAGWWPKYDLDYKDRDADDARKRMVVKCTLSEMDARLFALMKIGLRERECVMLRVVNGYVMSYRKMGVKLGVSHERCRELVMSGLKSLSVCKPFAK